MGPDFITQLSDLPALPEAACRTHPIPDYFFPEDIRRFTDRVRAVSSAMDSCARCPELQKCLEFGMRPENLRYGIYGGLMSGERLALAGERSTRARDQILDAREIRAAFALVENETPIEDVA